MIILKVAAQSFNPEPRPASVCEWCSTKALYKWGKRMRKVKDRTHSQATLQRYRCKSCGHTFTTHPRGLERSPQTQPYQATLIALYLLGLSFRNVCRVLSLLGLPSVSFATVWRHLQSWGENSRCPRLPTRWVGVDTTFVSVKGKTQGILIAVELGGRMVMVEAVGSPQEYQQAFATLRHLGVEVVVSDDDQAFVAPIEDQGLRRQGCFWHAQRALGRAFRKLSHREREQWQEVIALLKEALKNPPPRPPQELFNAQSLPLPPPLRGALVYILNLWNRLTLYQRLPGLPRTNNVTEQAIGRTKVRARSVRGFKSLSGTLNFFAATQALLASR